MFLAVKIIAGFTFSNCDVESSVGDGGCPMKMCIMAGSRIDTTYPMSSECLSGAQHQVFFYCFNVFLQKFTVHHYSTRFLKS